MHTNTKLVAFDLDGTLARSKSPLDPEMADLLLALLKNRSVAVITGGSYGQMQKQFIGGFPKETAFSNLVLLPTCGSSFYHHRDGTWKEVYRHVLTPEEKQTIMDAFDAALKESGFRTPEKLFGNILEDRETQISFSAFGQEAPLEIKEGWDTDHAKRKHIVSFLAPRIPDHEVRIGGATTIDVTRKGIDKAYGIEQLERTLGVPVSEMLFVGDALGEGGNDAAVIRTGIRTHAVRDPEDTKALIREIVAAR